MSQFDSMAWMYNPAVRLTRRESKYCHAIRSRAESAERVLDVGGGTGQIASCFASTAKKVVVLDPSREMLSRVTDRRIEKVRAKAQDIPFPDRSFDLVFCVDSLHHFANDSKRPGKAIDDAVEEMLRVLKTEGTLVVVDFDTGRLVGKIAALLERRMMGWDDVFFSPKGLQALFARHGMRTDAERLDWLSYVAVISKR